MTRTITVMATVIVLATACLGEKDYVWNKPIPDTTGDGRVADGVSGMDTPLADVSKDQPADGLVDLAGDGQEVVDASIDTVDVGSDVAPDVLPDVPTDATEVDVCTPACAGLACGEDGCGGSCGECNEHYACTDGQCLANCDALCASVECGYAGTDSECTCKNCDDDNACTEDLCDADAGKCAALPLANDPITECDDTNPCTESDVCVDGKCAGTLLPLDELDVSKCICEVDEDCGELENDDVCDGTLSCQDSGEDGVKVCLIDEDTVLDCQPDEDACTDDECDPVEGCVHPFNTTGCDDEDACTINDICAEGTCAGVDKTTVALEPESGDAGCDDGDPCTTDGCVAETGECTHDFNTEPCDDEDLCTVNDTCDGEGNCAGEDKTLVPDDAEEGEPGYSDGNVCTTEACNAEDGQCSSEFNTDECDDGNVCTTGDICANGSCVSSGWDDCDDDNVCTSDLCSPPDGCEHTPVAGDCDDDNLCTTDDICAEGSCAGTPYECEDNLDCTDNVCDGTGNCSYPLLDGWCLIGGECVAAGTQSPDNPCFACVPGTATDTYSPDDNQSCGPLYETSAIGCVAGICTILDCNQGYGHCDESHANGCETDTTTNLTHCGDCGKACDPGQVCSQSSCKNECDDGLTKCPEVGCVNTQENPLFCGNCETACAFDNANALCVLGECVMGDCLDTFGDANDKSDDGCECMVTNLGQELCNGWDDDCNGIDDDVADELILADPANCGECGTICPTGTSAQTATCGDKQCGLADCGDNLWDLNNTADDGCEYECTYAGAQETCNTLDDNCDGEVDEGFELATDLENCGICGNQCAHVSVSEYLCAGGNCIVLKCNDGFKDANNDGTDGCELEWEPDGELWVDSFDGGTFENGFDGSEDFPFSTIQEAVEYAFEGYLIHVNSGLYNEVTTIDIPGLILKGEERDSVIVSGQFDQPVIKVTADGVTIEALTVTGGGWGVLVEGQDGLLVQEVVIKNLLILNTGHEQGVDLNSSGIRLLYTTNATVSGVEVYGVEAAAAPTNSGKEGGNAAGFSVEMSIGSVISGCSVHEVSGGDGGAVNGGKADLMGSTGGLGAGVVLQGSTGCNVSGSSFSTIHGGKGGHGGWINRTGGTGGLAAGVFLVNSTKNEFESNEFTVVTGGSGGSAFGNPGQSGTPGQAQTQFGFYFGEDSWENNIDMDNMVDGYPVIYLYGAAEISVSGLIVAPEVNPTNLGSVVVVDSVGVILSQIQVEGFVGETGLSGSQFRQPGEAGKIGTGIRIEGCQDCIVKSCKVSAVHGGAGGAGGENNSGGEGGWSAGILLADCSDCQLVDNEVYAISGGAGAPAGQKDASGGAGGTGSGIRFADGTTASLNGNSISNIEGGSGGTGGYAAGADGADQVGFALFLEDDSLAQDVDLSNAYDSEELVYIYGADSGLFEDLNSSGVGNSTNLGEIVVLESEGIEINNCVVENKRGAAGSTATRGMFMGQGLAPGPGVPGVGIRLGGCNQCTVRNCHVSKVVGGTGGTGTYGQGEDGTGAGGTGGEGLGILLTDSPGSIVEDNSFETIGGGLGGRSGGNAPSGNGGSGIAVRLSESGLAEVTSNHISNLVGGLPGEVIQDGNPLGEQGGALGIHVSGSPSVAVSGCLIHDLQSGDSGPTSCILFEDGSGGSIERITCADLDTGGSQAGVGIWASGLVKVIDSIISSVDGYCLFADQENVTMLTAENANLHGCSAGQDSNATVKDTCIDEDPFFVDPDNGDFHLQPESPCIDAGKPTSDYDNEPEPNGCRVNMGAYSNTDEATSKAGVDHCPADCTPDCDGKVCGDDGCGGDCGVCGEGLDCVEGTCGCEPQCEGKECGDDGCEGACGVCGDNEVCDFGLCFCLGIVCADSCCDLGLVCHESSCCEPDCDDIDCGSDGCGGSCGECGLEELCIATFCMSPGTDCTDGNEDYWDGCTFGNITEWKANVDSEGMQTQPDVETLDAGKFVIVWTSEDDNETGIFGQMYSPLGQPSGGELQINSHNVDLQDNASLARLKDGGFVVAWRSAGQDGDNDGVYAQRFDASGATISTEFKANLYTISIQSEPAVTGLEDGGFLIVWHSAGQDGSGYGVVARRFTVDGLPSGGDQIINSITSESQMYPTIASLANGGYVGAWQGYTQSSQRDVFARKFESNGSAVDNDFQCNKGEAGNQEHPSLACYGDDVAVMWFHDGSYVGNGIAGAWVRFFPAQGVASNEVRVSKAGSKVHGYPSLAWIDDQKAVTVWHGTIPGGTSEIGARMVNTSAEALDEVFRVNTCFQGAQAQPALASFSDGSFIVVWKSQGQTDPDNPLDSDIYAQRFNADGTKKYK